MLFTSFLSVERFRHLIRHPSLRIASYLGVAIGGVVISRLIATVIQILLARWMGLADFGLYTTVFTLLGPVIMLASLGLDTWLLHQGGQAAQLDRAIGQVFGLRLVVTSILMTGAVIAILMVGPADLPWLLTVMAALVLSCELFLTTAFTALRAKVRNGAGAFVQIVSSALLLVLLWSFWDAQAPLYSAVGYRLLSSIGGLLLFAWIGRRAIHLVWQRSGLKAMLKSARIFFISDLLAAIALKADLTTIALLLGAVAVGTYNPALTIVNATFIIPQVAFQVFLPVLARQPSGSRTSRWMLWLMLIGSVVYGICLLTVLSWGAHPLIQKVYGDQYLAAVPLLQIMSAIPLFKSINFCWAMLMVARDQQPFRTKLQSIGALSNVAGNLILIPVMGLIGAAWVNLFTEVILVLCYSYGVWTIRESW